MLILNKSMNPCAQHHACVTLLSVMQESRIRNLDYGDRDSVGLFQQRVSTGWCPNGECSDPVKSSKAFYGVADFTNNQGLLQVPDWQNKAVTVVAQDVQVRAFSRM